jgi:putative acetyltransferase
MNDPARFSIRHADIDDAERLFDLWRRSVSATHTFLSAEEIEALSPAVRALGLQTLDTWILCGAGGQAVGFMVVEGPSVDALFLAPEWIGHGGGRLLIEHARSLHGRLKVDVNEQNGAALQFYLACGFRVIGRSATDSAGRPYPLLHLEEPS